MQQGRFGSVIPSLVLLLFWGLVSVLDHHCDAELTEKVLTRVTNLTLGSDRLGSAWVDRSLVNCAYTCLNKYSSRCQTIMYNSTTKLCTPGSFHRTYPAGAYLTPNSTEGDLYAPLTCDNSDNFTYVTSGNASACMLVYNDSMTYSDATAYCLSLGAHLFVARTTEKIELLPSGERIMIGLDDLEVEGTFVWVDNGEAISATYSAEFFKSGEPNDAFGVEDCVAVAPNNSVASANDFPCMLDRFRFACERPVLA